VELNELVVVFGFARLLHHCYCLYSSCCIALVALHLLASTTIPLSTTMIPILHLLFDSPEDEPGPEQQQQQQQELLHSIILDEQQDTEEQPHKQQQTDSPTSTATTISHSINTNNITMKRNRFLNGIGNGPDAAAGSITISSAPRTAEDLFEDLEPVLVLGVDISHYPRNTQFTVCAVGVFCFSLLYGYLQELISVHICHRQLGLFLAVAQFSGYTIWSFVLRTYVYEKQQRISLLSNSKPSQSKAVPFLLYLGLSVLRAIDLGMTNMAMQYVNYPAKTLMKSSRVVFTMLFGVLIARKTYRWMDYFVVLLMVGGLAIFMHADANSSAVFNSMGIMMLTVSLVCDGAISNMSETIMTNYGVGQDEFIFRMYSIALIAITAAAAVQGDLMEGFHFLTQPGTYAEMELPLSERTWTLAGKWGAMILFSTMGFFGSSCSAAITKHFGALTMSITSTARKATTLFLSFALFDNECTLEHVTGILIFICSLIWKSLAKRPAHPRSKKWQSAESLELLSSQPFVEPPSNYHVV
jgi:adenosine 3'-phospho 5'-phosphosulfate transporter B3